MNRLTPFAGCKRTRLRRCPRMSAVTSRRPTTGRQRTSTPISLGWSSTSSRGRRRSRHNEVSEQSWQRALQVLPGARRIGGRFPGRSGPNCFGAVMAAAGVPDADQVWMLREPFEEWLIAGARRGGSDEHPGTVLVWRSSDGLVQHAAVTLGDGLALHKPSQGWQSPTKILHTDEVKLSARSRGRRLQRYTIA